MTKTISPLDIDSYIAGFPKNVQTILKRIRTTIQSAAPNAKEVVSYRMPAFKGHEILTSEIKAWWPDPLSIFDRAFRCNLC